MTHHAGPAPFASTTRRRWTKRPTVILAVAAVTASLLGPMAKATAAPGTAAGTAATTRNPLVERTSTPVKYTYDGAGRLASVTDAAGQTATYKYDAEGNLTSITHSAASAKSGPTVTARLSGQPAPTIESVTPTAQSSGGEITIEGRGFSASASADVVRIGNLFAPVRHASSDRLVVTAPPSTGGTVTVLTPGGSASGPRVKVIEPRSPQPLSPGVNRRPLRAGPGVTALSGEVERPDGKPLAGVLVTLTTISGKVRARTMTRGDGRFVLSHVDSGRAELIINGNHVAGDSRYGLYAEPVQLPAGRTTVLPWVTYLTALDETHAIMIASPTTHPISLTSPRIPGLIVQIPTGTVIHDYYGRVVHRISLTPLAVGRTPFPWAPGMVPQYFSLQPGDATVSGPGLRVIYPNDSNEPPGTSIAYLVDSPDWPGTGWWRYGTGHVSANGRQIIPDRGTVYNKFLPGGYPDASAPGEGPPPGSDCACGDPVDPSTGLEVFQQTDLSLADVEGVTLTRVFRQLDDTVRDFGIGMSDSLNLYISVGANGDFDLVLPNGGHIAYAPTSVTGVYDAVGDPTAFFGSTLTMGSTDPDGPFTVAMTNGTHMDFGNPAYLTAVTDRFGNTVKINRTEYTYVQDGGGQIQTVVTPDGRWLKFTYGVCVAGSAPSYCVTEVQDSLGRTVSYTYDANGRLTEATEANGGHTTYTWAPCTSSLTCTEMLSVTDADSKKIDTNTYDPSTGRVTTQTGGDGGTWSYSYQTSGSGAVTQTDVTDPAGVEDSTSFDANGYSSSETVGVGGSHPETTTTVYDPTTALLTSSTDPLGRLTTYGYDALGNLTSVTELSGTAHPSIYNFTYDPTYNRLTSTTDPLGHTTSIAYNDKANTETYTNALGRKWLITLNDEGQPIGETDPLGHVTYLSYLYNDLVAVMNPLGQTTSIYRDGVGRPLQVTDPLGNVTSYSWTPIDLLAQQTSPLGATTVYGYDLDGNVTSLKDADGHSTTFAYDAMGNLVKQTDALGRSETYSYDRAGDLTRVTDRNGAVTGYSYDSLDRLLTVKYGLTASSDQSSVIYSWDGANRLTKVVDSTAGTYGFTYDGLNDITSASSPQGTIAYTYNADGLPTSMSVPHQSEVTYGYDVGGELTGITQGSSQVTLGYSASGLPTSLTLPDGIIRSTSYDAASDPTAVTFTHGTTNLGALDYTYDADGLINSVAGSLARINLPPAISSSTYDAANELVNRDGTVYGYDKDGNLTSDGTDTYGWNDRGELSSIKGTTSASFVYSPFGQQASSTVAGSTTSYLYDGSNVVQELSGNTPTENLLTGGTNQIFQLTTPSGTNSSYLTDVLGSTVALAGSNGQITTSYTYDPNGTSTASGAATPNSFEFTGSKSQAAGLDAMGARDYSPSLGQFISQDPTEFYSNMTDLYGYTPDNAVNAADPTGQFCWQFWSTSDCSNPYTQAVEAYDSGQVCFVWQSGCSGPIQNLICNTNIVENTPGLNVAIRLDPVTGLWLDTVERSAYGSGAVSNGQLVWDVIGVGTMGFSPGTSGARAVAGESIPIAVRIWNYHQSIDAAWNVITTIWSPPGT